MSPTHRKNPLGTTAFLDILLNALGTFITLFVLAFILIREEQPKKQEQPGYVEGIYRITAQWPKNRDEDIDLYVRDPLRNIVYFNNRSRGLMHLENDDLGLRSDTIETPHGPAIAEDNIEHVIIRGTVAGEYIVNVHWYRSRGEDSVPVTITLRKSATNEVIAQRQVILLRQGSEQTAFRFILDTVGIVAGINQLPYEIVPQAKSGEGTPTPRNPFGQGRSF